MKKQGFVFLLTVVLVCILAACSCQHEWAQATCTEEGICTRCGQKSEEALGHDFAPATCKVPEICTRCGQTQGTTLEHAYRPADCTTPETCTYCGATQGEVTGHRYGRWNVAGETMTRQCSICNQDEIVPVDYSLVLGDALQGHWDLRSIYMNGQSYSAYQLMSGYLGIYLNFKEGNHAELYLDQEGYPKDVVWDFVTYSDDDGDSTCTLVITQYAEDSAEVELSLMALYVFPTEKEDSEKLYVMLNSDSYYVLSRNQAVADAMTGCWISSSDGEISTLVLKEDGSFIANMGEEITGTWHLKPIRTSGEYRYTDMILHYYKDETWHLAKVYLDLGNNNTEPWQYTEYLRQNHIYIYDENFPGSFHYGTQEDITRLEKAMEEGKAVITGKWGSHYVVTYRNDDRDETNTDDYSITFMEDGTFTAMLDKERSGTWRFSEADVRYETTYFYYHLKFEGVEDEVSVHIYEDKLSLQHYNNQTQVSTTVYFQSMTVEKIAQRKAAYEEALEQVLGEWVSMYTIEYPDNGGMKCHSTLGQTLQIREDGTFTVELDQTLSGTWTFRELNTHQYEDVIYKTYTFFLECDKSDITLDVSIYSSGGLSAEINTPQHRQSMEFERLTEENLQTLRESAKAIPGTWITEHATLNGEPVEDCAYTMTIRADGTYSAQFSVAHSGTWACSYSKDGGCVYNFYTGNRGMGYQMNEDDRLIIWDEIEAGRFMEVILKKA